ncbi:hypothetical protein ETH_00008695 [Eimeria tenella]|uniref:SAG family member n=1 Tax=Eimeria tenella TaxID=5802 RepID=U6KZ58_EIMTE|nr:hypothetical protein ETH_00008695 [Eimeria tenella]CDJ43256.1 hypothetical protein ETH_00008695 [Eimeria tenella]|eukprot:XP_013234006.1 hypothetical protein ETH_00008695 [Eimeria tenella]
MSFAHFRLLNLVGVSRECLDRRSLLPSQQPEHKFLSKFSFSPLTAANDGEATESLTEIGKTEPDSLTTAKIAYPGLVIPFAHDEDFDCNALIQATYTAGLDHLKQSNFEPSTGTYNAENAPFDNVAASNVAFLLSAKSTKVSCAATKDCKAGHDVLSCYFIDPLQTGDKPFTTELYNALWGLETGAAFISVPSAATVLLVLALVIRN